jgi:hypothetical protein
MLKVFERILILIAYHMEINKTLNPSPIYDHQMLIDKVYTSKKHVHNNFIIPKLNTMYIFKFNR